MNAIKTSLTAVLFICCVAPPLLAADIARNIAHDIARNTADDITDDIAVGDLVFYEGKSWWDMGRMWSILRQEATVTKLGNQGKAFIEFADGSVREVALAKLHAKSPSIFCDNFEVGQLVQGHFTDPGNMRLGAIASEFFSHSPPLFKQITDAESKTFAVAPIEGFFNGGWATVKLPSGRLGYARVKKLLDADHPPSPPPT